MTRYCRCLWALLLVLLTGLTGDAATTDIGDHVYFTGPGEIDVPGNLKVGGVAVSLAGASGSEYAAARLATTGNITLSGEQTIDGVLTAGSAVVVWLQTSAIQNGIYSHPRGAGYAGRILTSRPSLRGIRPCMSSQGHAMRAPSSAWPIRGR